MSEDRTLDLEVMQKVCGWRWISQEQSDGSRVSRLLDGQRAAERVNALSRHYEPYTYGFAGDTAHLDNVPHVSTDMAATWTYVVARMLKRSYWLTVVKAMDTDDMLATFESDFYSQRAYGATASEAICKAALSVCSLDDTL